MVFLPGLTPQQDSLGRELCLQHKIFNSDRINNFDVVTFLRISSAHWTDHVQGTLVPVGDTDTVFK